MFRGIYTAANAMQTKQNQIDIISNNIANIDTTGFKKDVGVIEAFSEKLLYKRENIEGYMRAIPNKVTLNNVELKDGRIKTDISISRGYLTLEDKNGKGYYKSASLVRDDDGYLRTVYRDYDSKTITKFGSYLLDENGKRINVQEGELSVDTLGNLMVGRNTVAKLIVPEARKSIGTINSGVLTDRVMINFNQGAQEMTENPMHIALEGDGFFKVQIAGTQSVKYSRSGAFTMDKDRILRDFLGNIVLSEDGNGIEVPQDSTKMEFKQNGVVVSLNAQGQRQEIGKISLVNISNKEDMQKYGHSYMQMIGKAQPNEVDFEGKVLQGYLEKSNVSGIDEMVDMIAMFRGFESDQKVINAYDQIMQKAANDLGKI